MKPIVFDRHRRQLRLPHRGDVAAADHDPAARRLVDAGDQVQERRLARAGRPHQRDVLPFRDVEIEAHQDRDLDLIPAVDLLDMLDAKSAARPCSVLLSFGAHLVAVLQLRSPASETRRSPPWRPCDTSTWPWTSPAGGHGREHGLPFDDAEDAGPPVHGRQGRLRNHDARAGFLSLRGLGGERHARREIREHVVVGVEERHLHPHRALLPVGRRDDLAQPCRGTSCSARRRARSRPAVLRSLERFASLTSAPT